jgi:hypothetical protein
MPIDLFTACGIVGVACYVVAYFAALQGWADARGWRFPAANLIGALLLLVSLYDAWNLPSVIIESFWAVISLYGVARSLMRRSPPT